MTDKEIIDTYKYVKILDSDDLHQEWSVADLVWLIYKQHGALEATLEKLNEKGLKS